MKTVEYEFWKNFLSEVYLSRRGAPREMALIYLDEDSSNQEVYQHFIKECERMEIPARTYKEFWNKHARMTATD